MSITRKLVLLAVTAISLLAMAAPAAIAQTSVEPELHIANSDLRARAEPPAVGPPCTQVLPGASTVPGPVPPTTSGGCFVHVEGPNIVLQAHVGGGMEVTVSTCDVEINARIDNDAEGWLTHPELTQGAAGTCTRTPCGSAANSEGRAWGFHMRETAPNTKRATVLFCLEEVGTHAGQTHCEVDIPFTETGNHRYQFNNTGANGVTCHANMPPTEVIGTFASETDTNEPSGEAGVNEQQVEINHL